jgi:HK97 family phage prohead protease
MVSHRRSKEHQMSNLRTERAEEVRHVEFRASDEADGQTLEGYGAVFNQWTDIRDSMGTYRERIAPGAFKRSLGQRTPVLQFDHGSHPLIGSLPLGSISVLREDRNGLFVKARLSDNWLIQPVRDAIREKAISGMSFRFRVVDEDWGTDDQGDTRTIKEVELLELGPVVFPAYTQTSVSVRSLIGALDDDTRAVLARELETRTDEAVIDAGDEESPDFSTSPVAGEPASDDSPDEPPVASHADNRTQIAEALARFRHHTERKPDVDQ